MKKTVFLLIISFLFVQKTFTQTAEIDSSLFQLLENNLKILEDEVHFDFFFGLEKGLHEQDKVNAIFLFLEKNNYPQIEIGVHTDCRGDEKYNLDLSERQSENFQKWLIHEGIERSKIVSVGYGENQVLEKCKCEDCTEEQHEKNERVSIKLLQEIENLTPAKLEDRAVLSTFPISKEMDSNAIIVIKVCVDSLGYVIDAEFSPIGSTSEDKRLIDEALLNAAKWKFAPADIVKQCGTIKYEFKKE